MKNNVKRSFSSLVRMPYQDAIAVILHIIDFHYDQAIAKKDKKEFHLKQANRLKAWLVDIKEYIVEAETKIK
tara:strand:+ start:156 stop:371 length:216 start_codon:yes stop_codon:yes gene_type:complete